MKIKKIAQSAGLLATVVDNLNSNSATDALSAKQGKELKNIIEALEESLIISFTIDGAPHQALRGMSWWEWVNSAYNTIGASTMYSSTKIAWQKSNTRYFLNLVELNDVINAGYAYTSSGTPIP